VNDLPRYPDGGDDDGPATKPPNFMRVVGIVIIVVVVATIVGLHLTGAIGPGSH
jgi:hypothetical protein